MDLTLLSVAFVFLLLQFADHHRLKENICKRFDHVPADLHVSDLSVYVCLAAVVILAVKYIFFK